ncbi:hypothetical protein K0M31_017451, partial [Melipona bicolor]
SRVHANVKFSCQRIPTRKFSIIELSWRRRTELSRRVPSRAKIKEGKNKKKKGRMICRKELKVSRAREGKVRTVVSNGRKSGDEAVRGVKEKGRARNNRGIRTPRGRKKLPKPRGNYITTAREKDVKPFNNRKMQRLEQIPLLLLSP